MLKVLNAHQIKALDASTIEHEPVASIDLMERACRMFITWFTEEFDSAKKIGIVCGTGNNGGDGLCIARVLHDRNYAVKVWIVRGGSSESEDFKTNLKRLSGKIKPVEITSLADSSMFADRDILIDGIFGSGLSRPVEGVYAQVITSINEANAVRVAIDIPSGLFADKHTDGKVVKAHHTVSFQLPKLAFFLPENYAYTGEWHIVKIGLDKNFTEAEETAHYFLERRDLAGILRSRSKFSNKGNFGKALIIAGSYGKMGAAVIASHAAMRSGLGLLTVHIPKCGYTILQTSMPEAMASIDDHDHFFTSVPSLDGYDTIGIGPGIGKEKETVKAFREVLEKSERPVVIDADALNILAGNNELLGIIPPGSILTPHPKEFERLAGTWKDDFERLEKVKQLAKQIKSIIVLKGAYTSIVSPEGKVYFNPTGNPGMATGGTGDALTGILTGLLAQNYTSLEAAQLGVYLHGLAGDLAAKEKSMEALIASDVIAFLPQAFLNLHS